MAFHGLSKAKLAKERIRKNTYNHAKKSSKEAKKLRKKRKREEAKQGAPNLIKINK